VVGERSAFPSGVRWLELGVWWVAAVWCRWMLLEFFLPQAKNKLDVEAKSLDPGFGISLCRSTTVV
jgi:hypothetical protein